MHNRPPFRPVQLSQTLGIVGLITVVTFVIGALLKWKDFKAFFFPEGRLLSWEFCILLILLLAGITWFVMNQLWLKEQLAHDLTKKDRDNLQQLLRVSENERLTDVITGVPNARSLEKDLQQFRLERNNIQRQFILIDLKDFRNINKKFGYSKTNNLLRQLAQSIYKKMRRNEDMYRYLVGADRAVRTKGFYRVYPGGDEFAFVIEGDQADAIGFCNRLTDQFKELARSTDNILGKRVALSFHCAIVEMDPRDEFSDVFTKAEQCYQISKEGTQDFTLCWHPVDRELRLSTDTAKKGIYMRARSLFEVLTLTNK